MKDDGGPIFSEGEALLTLRDYFAAAAIQSYIFRASPEEIAMAAYKLADAMLEMRDTNNETNEN